MRQDTIQAWTTAAMLRQVAELAPAPIAVVAAPDWRFVFANRACRCLAGSDAPDILGRGIEDLFPAAEAEILSLIEDAWRTGHTATRRAFPVALRPGDSTRWWNFEFVPLPAAESGAPAVLILARDVTKDTLVRQTAEHALTRLRDREAELARVQRIGRLGGFVLEPHTGMIHRSPEYLALHSLPPQASEASFADFLRRVDPEDRVRVETAIMDALEGRSPAYAAEFRITGGDGARRWVLSKAEVERNAQGQPLRMVGAQLDVTAQRNAEMALQESEGRLRSALRSARLGVWEHDLRTGSILWDERASEIYGGLAQAQCGPDLDGWRGRVHPEDRARSDAAMAATADPGGPDEYDVEFRFLGADGIWRWTAMHGAVTQRDPQTGRALRLTGVVQDITSRKAEQEALAASEAEYRATFETAAAGMMQCDLRTGRFLRVNRRFCEITGRTEAELLGGLRIEDVIHPEDRTANLDGMRQLAKGEEYAAELRYLRPDSRVAWVRFNAAPVPGPGGRPARVIAVVRDVTARRRAEAALAASEARYRTLIENLPAIVYKTLPSAPVDRPFVSARIEALLGIFPAECARHPRLWVKHLHPDDRTRVLAEIAAAAKAHTPFRSEYRMVARNGRVLWLRDEGEWVRSTDGRVLALQGVLLDITERKAAEAALQAGEARLRIAQEAARIGIFEYDLLTDRHQWDARMLELWGMTEQTEIDRNAMRSVVHSEDHPLLDAALERAIDPRGDGRYGVEYRVRNRTDGVERWVAASGAVTFEDGRPLRLIGTVMDVTERRHAEKALAAGEQRLRLATEAAALGVFEWHIPTDTAMWENPRMYEIVGRRPTEGPLGISEFVARVLHPDDAGLLDDAIKRSARKGEPLHVICRIHRLSDGALRWIEIAGSLARSPDGTPLRLVGVVGDVTHRREAEDRQALLAHEVDHRAKNILAVVSSLLHLTPVSGDAASYAAALRGRVTAMARAHELLARERWAGADVRRLAEEELAAFRPAGGESARVSLVGQAVVLPAHQARPFAMVLHELTTNAAKHGALSTPAGRLDIAWRLEGASLRLQWTEHGSPVPAAEPPRRGFGSRLMETTVRGQLAGDISFEWAPDGLRCEVTIPRAVEEGEAMPGA